MTDWRHLVSSNVNEKDRSGDPWGHMRGLPSEGVILASAFCDVVYSKRRISAAAAVAYT